MPKFPLIGPSYTSQSVNADCQTTMNLYPEQIESGAGNNQIVLYPTPGLKGFTDLTPVVPDLLQPEIVDVNQYGWDTAGGSNSGNSRINVPVLTATIQPGDILFLLFNATVGPGKPYNPILTITAPSLLAGSFTRLGDPYYDLGLLAIPNEFRFFQVFYAVAENSVPSTTLLVNLNLTSIAFNNFDMGGAFLLVRNILALDQLTSLISPSASISAPAITTTVPRFVFTFFGSNEALSTPHPDPTIYHFFTPGSSGMAAIAAFFILDPMLGTIYTAPAGVYSPAWAKAGSFLAVALNVSFSIKPA